MREHFGRGFDSRHLHRFKMNNEKKDIIKKTIENSFNTRKDFLNYYASSKENLLNQQLYLLLTVNIISITFVLDILFSKTITDYSLFFWSVIILTIFLTFFTISFIKETIDKFDKNLDNTEENINKIHKEILQVSSLSLQEQNFDKFYDFIKTKHETVLNVSREQKYQGEIIYFLFILITINCMLYFLNLNINLNLTKQILAELFVIVFSFNFSLTEWSYNFTDRISKILDKNK